MKSEHQDKEVLSPSDRMRHAPHRTSSVFSSIFYRFLAFMLRVIFRLNGGIDLQGIENIPLTGGAIIAANHVSYLDPPLLGAILPRQATFMARRGLFHIPVIKWIIKQYAIPVDRDRTHPSTLKEAVYRVRKGELLVIFPEGRRSDDGTLLEAKRGVGMIAQRTKAVVIPAFIMGTRTALPPDARWLKRARIKVVFDKPLYTPRIYEDGKHSSLEITRKIMGGIGSLSRQYADHSG